MKFFKSNFIFAIFAFCLLATSTVRANNRYSGNFVWVTVNGIKITDQRANAAIEKDVQMAMTLGQPPSAAAQFNMKLSEIDKLIEKVVIEQQMKDKKISVTIEEVTKEIARIAKSNKISVQQFYNRTYSTQNITPTELKEQIAMGMRFDKLIDKVAGPKYFNVSDSVAKRYYNKNKKKAFTRPPMVRASHIMIKYEANDKSIKEKVKYAMGKMAEMARKGKDFGELAKKYSQDTVTNKKGGDLGLVYKGTKMIPPQIEEVIFSLKAGEISDVIEMPYGCHVIKVLASDPGGVISFDKVKDDIKNWIKDDMKAEFSAKYIDQLMANAKIVWTSGKRPEPIPIAPTTENHYTNPN